MTVASLINSLAESQKKQSNDTIADADAVWEKAVGLFPNNKVSVYTLNALLKLASRLPGPNRAARLFPLHQIPVIADAVTFSSALSLYARKGSFQDCQAIYLEMLDRGLEPSVQDYTSLLVALKHSLAKCNFSWSPKFKKLYSLRVSDTLSACEGRIAESKAIKSITLELYTRLGLWDGAVQFIQRHISPQLIGHLKDNAQLDGYILKLCLSCLARSRSPKSVFRFFETVLSKGFRPDSDDINNLLSACHTCNLSARAESIHAAYFMKKKGSLSPTEATQKIMAQFKKD